MSEPKTAESTDAREASVSRVTTLETLQEKAASQKDASEPAEVKPEESPDPGEAQKPKKSAQERIIELAAKRREAEEKAEARERENRELRERLQAIERGAPPPVEQTNRPQRNAYTSEEDYIEALTEWKATEAIAKREKQEREARVSAQFEAIESRFKESVTQARKEFDDFDEVVGNSTVEINDTMQMAIKDSDNPAAVLYYLAMHPKEARQIAALRWTLASKAIDAIDRELSDKDETPAAEAAPRKRAPDPITPLKGAAPSSPAAGESFDQYRARRAKELGRR